MEAFSLLKYWRSSVPPAGGGDAGGGGGREVANASKAISVTAVGDKTAEDEDDDDDDGPFFDLEFPVPEQDFSDEQQQETTHRDEKECVEESCSDDEGEKEFNFTLSSSSTSSNNNSTEQNITTLSPSDELFFKGKLIPIEPNISTKTKPHPQFPVSLLKSATKFRVFMLGLKKPNLNSSTTTTTTTPNRKVDSTHEDNKNTNNNKSFTVKLKVEEVPVLSLFTRDNSSKNNHKLSEKPNILEESAVNLEEKKFTKEVMHKYFNKVKPLYVRVSRRYGEKLRFSGQLNINNAAQQGNEIDTIKNESVTVIKGQPKQGSGIFRPAKLRVVRKHFGKSRSASSAVVAEQPHSAANFVSSHRRRDDSLLQQQDGIQSAILHCKRSFNASRGTSTSSSTSESPPTSRR